MNPNDENKYKDVINTLRQLQQVKAPKGFEADLIRRIHTEEPALAKPSWRNIFIPSRLIPTAALALTALLLIIVLDHSSVSIDNPLMTVPRERQNVTVSTETNNATQRKKALKNEEFSAQKEITGIQKKDEDKIVSTEPTTKTKRKMLRTEPPAVRSPEGNKNHGGSFITADFTSDRINNYPVNKAGLNFRQINLSNEQKIQLDQLKEKMEKMFKTREKQ